MAADNQHFVALAAITEVWLQCDLVYYNGWCAMGLRLLEGVYDCLSSVVSLTKCHVYITRTEHKGEPPLAFNFVWVCNHVCSIEDVC